LRLYRNLDASARAWSEAGALAEPAGGGGLSVLFLWVSLGLGLIVMLWSRRRMRELLPPGAGLPGPMPGALASPFDRGLAFLFDAALALPLPVAYRLAASDLDLFSPLPEGEAAMLYWVWIGGLSLLMIVGEWSGLGSVGKRILGLRVRSVSGGAPSAPQTLIRNLVRIVDFWPFRILGVSVPYLVALVSSTVSPRRQRLGDLFAGTVVRRHVPLSRREIVLASASPRRRDLLGGFGLRFRVEVPAVDEERLAAGLTAAQEIVLRLAVEKAAAVASRLRGFEVVIAADTVVALDDEILGKPKDRTEAVAMLAKLSGRTHRVLTGVAILDRATGQRLAHVETTEVDLRPLSAEEIAAYVDSGEADGKAGAYAIQETADRFVSELRGSFTNVVGLPTEAIAGMFEALDG